MRHGRNSSNWRLGGLAVIALLPALVILAGCAAEQRPEKQRPQPQVMVAPRGATYWLGLLQGDAASWSSLEADCTMLITSPRIETPTQRVQLAGGRLDIQKPGKICLRMPKSGDLALLLVGDGSTFSVDAPVLQNRYGGDYEDDLIPQPRRIHVLPADIVDAFDPMAVLGDRVVTVAEDEQLSLLLAHEPVEKPTPHLRTTGIITFNRKTESIFSITKYDSDGSIRVRVVLMGQTAVATGPNLGTRVPSQLLISYPKEQTGVLVRLSNIQLDVPMDDDLFQTAP